MQRREHKAIEHKPTSSVRRGEAKHSLDAAALQNEFARKYNLPGSHMGIQTKSRSTGQRSGSDNKLCPSCNRRAQVTNGACSACGFFVQYQSATTTTLAQSRGLVAGAPQTTALTAQQWSAVEEKLAHRGDAHCPICMEGFNQGYEVLLSCSHMYHRKCLQSFENFMKVGERMCPICRTSNYQKKVTHRGSEAFAALCVVTIQRYYRGYRCRCQYYTLLRRHYQAGLGQNRSLRKKFYEKEWSHYTSKLDKEFDSRCVEVNSMFHSVDATLQASRALDLEFEMMLINRHYNFEEEEAAAQPKEQSQLESSSLSQEEWKDVYLRCMSRGFSECAICMGPVHRGHRRIALLSCSHAFHDNCISNFETFARDKMHTCPVCRTMYVRRLLSRCCTKFDDN